MTKDDNDSLDGRLAELVDLVLDQLLVAPRQQGLWLPHAARFPAGEQNRGDGHSSAGVTKEARELHREGHIAPELNLSRHDRDRRGTGAACGGPAPSRPG